MTTTMIPDAPEPGDNRWFTRLTGDLTAPFEPRLVVDPAAPPLPKRPCPKHRTGVPAAQLIHSASLAAPTAADLRQVREVVNELHALVDRAMDGTVADATRALAAADDDTRGEMATHAARRTVRGHLDRVAREALAGVLYAYGALPSTEVLPVALLATLETAVAVLSASRADLQLADETDGRA